MAIKSIPSSFDSIQQASAVLGLPALLLKRAKAAGCPNFRGSRVYTSGLAEWLAEHKEELSTPNGKEALQIQKLLEECRKLKIANDLKERELIPRREVAEKISQFAAEIVPHLEQKLCNEYPSTVAGLDIPQAREYGMRLFDEIVGSIQKYATLWD